MNIDWHDGWSLRTWIAMVAVLAGLHPVLLEGQAGAPMTLWLPYASGSSAQCAQGAMSGGTHRGLHAWDFMLAEGESVVAAAPGRVIRVTDERRTTGSNDFDLANHIFVDVGDGRFMTYTHHGAGTARVAPGDIVAAGTRLADVGRTGTIQPHIHFDVVGRYDRLVTQMYFPREPLNESDSIFSRLGREAKSAAIARVLPPTAEVESDSLIVRWDVVLNRG